MKAFHLLYFWKSLNILYSTDNRHSYTDDYSDDNYYVDSDYCDYGNYGDYGDLDYSSDDDLNARSIFDWFY